MVIKKCLICDGEQQCPEGQSNGVSISDIRIVSDVCVVCKGILRRYVKNRTVVKSYIKFNW